jgi:hypothetical protein
MLSDSRRAYSRNSPIPPKAGTEKSAHLAWWPQRDSNPCLQSATRKIFRTMYFNDIDSTMYICDLNSEGGSNPSPYSGRPGREHKLPRVKRPRRPRAVPPSPLFSGSPWQRSSRLLLSGRLFSEEPLAGPCDVVSPVARLVHVAVRRQAPDSLAHPLRWVLGGLPERRAVEPLTRRAREEGV